MKLTAVLLLSACLMASANGKAQQITISEKNITLEKVFSVIEKQTAYSFVYTDNLLQHARKINVEVKGASLEQVLAICFKDQPYTYTISDRFIVIKQKQESPNAPGVYPELVPESTTTIDIRGRITNENNEPVVASVMVKGTTLGATSNAEGFFALAGVEPNAVLVITGVSIEPLEVKLGGRTNLTLTTKTKVDNLKEVIINKGYYTEKQKLSVSNVGRVTAKDIEKQPVQNVLLALQARVPGLFITQPSGIPGAGIKVRIQGQNSLRNGSNPLYVVDGVQIDAHLPTSGIGGILGTYGIGNTGSDGNPLSYINPMDIESVEILKDADATAIYGSRAANGAILITTKKGKAGAMKLDLDMQTGWGKMARRIDMMNTRQYLDMRYEAFANDKIDWRNASANDLKVWDTTRYTNWQDELLGGTAIYNNINATVSGGSPNIRYLVSGTYNKQTTVFPFPKDFADQKAAVHFNINATSNNNKMHMQFSGNYMFDNNQLPLRDITQYAVLMEPHAPQLLNADGSINWAPDASGNTTLGDANVMVQRYLKYVNKTHNLVSSLNLNYTILPGLIVSSSFGYNYMQTNEYSPSPLIAVDPVKRATTQRSAAFGNMNLQSWIIEPQVTYSRNISKGKLNVFVGTTFQNKTASSGYLVGTGQLSDELLSDINSAATVSKGPFSSSDYRYNAVFGRANYNWSDKYILSLNARRDGSTRFGAENRFHNFGSVGAGWIFSSEKFFSSFSHLISFGKLRASYGTTGSDQIGDYQFMSLYNIYTTSVPYQGITGLQPAGLPNPKLEWEETRKLQAGLDLGFWQDKLVVNATYVQNRSSNQLLSYALPSPAGLTSFPVNLPATIQNKNWEFMVTGKIIEKKNFNWTSTVNLTIPQNKLLTFPTLADASSSLWHVGAPVDATLYLQYIGVAAGTGDYLFADQNGHATITPNAADRTVLISKTQKFYGGFDNTISYKTVQLSFIFQFVRQTGYDDTRFWNGNRFPGQFAAGVSNQPLTVLNRWQKAGDNNVTVGRYRTSEPSNLLGSDVRFTDDASYIRLKNISLSWDLPKTWIDKAHFRNFRMYVHAQNLFILTNYKGLDPETQTLISLPPLQIWTVGVQAGL